MGALFLSPQPLDYEKKKSYTLQVQVRNTHPDPRYVSVDAKDLTTVRVSVEDMDEPPRFERPSYVMELAEDAAVGTAIGSVSAVDQDARRSPVKYAFKLYSSRDSFTCMRGRAEAYFRVKMHFYVLLLMRRCRLGWAI